MKKVIILIIVLFSIPSVLSIFTGDSTMGIDISWDGGNNYTSAKGQSWTCNVGDQYKTSGNSSELWGRNWTVDEFNNTNFRIRMNLTDQAGANTRMYVDHIQVKVYYTLPSPQLTFISPTPANNSNIGSTLYFNVSSDLNLTNCTVEHNETGSFVNYSATLENTTICSGNVIQISNGSTISYRVFGNTGSSINFTETRIANVVSTAPTITLISPANATTDPATSRNLTWNLTDPENDLMEVTLYASNISSLNSSHIVKYTTDLANGSYAYNFTTMPIDENSQDLYAMYHLNNDSNYGESDSVVYDFSGNNHNGTPASGAVVNYTDGKIYGAYSFNGNAENIKIGDNYDFHDLCQNGCTFSAWVLRYGMEWDVILSRYGSSPEQFFFILDSDTSNRLRFRIFDDYDNSSASCTSQIESPNLINETNKWYHVVGGFNTTHCYTYLDGTLLNTTSTSINPNSTNWNYTQNTLIGAMHVLSPAIGVSWNGLIDEVGIWNRSLTSAEILDLYRLRNDTYYWNASVTDGVSNTSELWQFTVGEVIVDCNIDCAVDDDITSNLDCENENLTFTNSGNIIINANITNIDTRIIEIGCETALANGNKLDYI